MRLIDADALEKEGWRLHRTIRVDKNTDEYQTKSLIQIPTIEPEQAFSIYAKSVLAWLIDYQIKAAELKGSYSPFEVLSWVINDWRKASGIINIENDNS